LIALHHQVRDPRRFLTVSEPLAIRIPNRSGMTTVTFQGQPGGLPAAEWTHRLDRPIAAVSKLIVT